MILNIRNVVTLSKTQYFEISIAIKKKEKTDLSCKRTIGYLDKDSIEIYIFQKYNHFPGRIKIKIFVFKWKNSNETFQWKYDLLILFKR